MIGQVQGNVVELTKPTASAAILRSDERFPDFPLSFEQYGVEIDLRHIPGENPGSDTYWKAARTPSTRSSTTNSPKPCVASTSDT